MKPKDLKYPFPFADRRPLLQEGVFYVPEYYEEHHHYSFPSFEEIFGNDHPVHLEYCSGNGTWIAEKAFHNPEINWVAVERDFERVRKIVSKARNENLKNLLVVSGEALTFTHHYLKADVLAHVYVNFPDPWPKKRHAKHRIFQLPFVSEVARVLKEGHGITAVTDDPPYSEQIREVMLGSGFYEPVHPEPFFVTEKAEYGSSFFEELWRSKGKTIHYIEAKKRDQHSSVDPLSE